MRSHNGTGWWLMLLLPSVVLIGALVSRCSGEVALHVERKPMETRWLDRLVYEQKDGICYGVVVGDNGHFRALISFTQVPEHLCHQSR